MTRREIVGLDLATSRLNPSTMRLLDRFVAAAARQQRICEDNSGRFSDPARREAHAREGALLKCAGLLLRVGELLSEST